MPTEVQKAFEFNPMGLRILHEDRETMFPIDGDGLVHLNPMWDRVGRPDNKDPWRWAQTVDGQTSIDTVAKNLSHAKNVVWKAKRGKYLGGTWAHWRIAVAYGMYLDSQAKYSVIEGWAEHKREELDPGLKMDRAVEGYKKKGKTDSWIERRFKQIGNKKALDSSLKSHEVEGGGYAICYDAINVKVLGGTSKECKSVLGLKDHDSLRDSLDLVYNAGLDFAQILAREKIEKLNVRGNNPCRDVCAEAGQYVSNAMSGMGIE